MTRFTLLTLTAVGYGAVSSVSLELDNDDPGKKWVENTSFEYDLTRTDIKVRVRPLLTAIVEMKRERDVATMMSA